MKRTHFLSKTPSLTLILGLVLAALGCSLTVFAGDDGLKVEVTPGYSWFTDHGNFGPYSMNGTSLGLNIGQPLSEGLELDLFASRTFMSASDYVYSFGITPAWRFAHVGPALFFAGLSAEGLVLHEDYSTAEPTGVDSFGDPIYPKISTTRARFAIGPTLGTEFAIWNGIVATPTIRMTHAFGPEGNLNSLELSANVGYRF